MSGEKHVTVILIIVLVIVALVSTYAWFTTSTNYYAIGTMTSGSHTSFNFVNSTGETVNDSDYVEFDDYPGYNAVDEVHTPVYSGQKGYQANGNPYLGSDAPFYLFKNISYKMQGATDIVLTVYLERFIVEVDEESYNYTFEQSLVNICGLSTETAATIAADSEARTAYYILESAYSANNEANPSTGSQNIFMIVDNATDLTVVGIVYKGEVVSSYMTLDYWKSNGTSNSGRGVLISDSPTSAVGTGITLHYGQEEEDDVCEAGKINYVGVYVGFYGYDSVNEKYTECAFSGSKFRGSNFNFIFSAGGAAA